MDPILDFFANRQDHQAAIKKARLDTALIGSANKSGPNRSQ